jgi:hypothetical protein
MGKTVRGLFLMILMTGLAVALLAAAKWLPSLMQTGFARQYDSVEEASRSLGLGNVPVPAYFPEGITWPPSLIFAQKDPYTAVVMEFKESGTKKTALILIQASSDDGGRQLQRIALTQVKEETQYRLKEKTVLLQVGMCDTGTPCSKMVWQDNGLYHTLLLMSSPFELIKIAESMIR